MTATVELEVEIEALREEMYQLYKNDPTDPQLVSVSQSLDQLLNKLNYMLQT
ncbi:Spo0E like sporulation regulatory protein [Thalassobacillus cyri]|uniref:Spo0E like sporulation regulatory protein n=1 Tax=Thalassobacillus cyri TaxID=571932 RepID=A0A1H4APQ6_9BACI|nr:aspartyl-phosphate phosphatase Spo0E family protein [Thalassobacillus cyri]SEA37831.1 Spo0E like sporulation regulatory protein [Thalassobacillus cyri]